jgi:hypothetical protein
MYNDFQQRLAALGFTSTPITEAEYNRLIALGFDDDAAEDIAADVASGWTLEDALQAYD